ncbi:MAG: hypothetical protein K6F75_04980 [Butyrivibrio sp.]|nr:hypothetical protein [Butyrivibrio sp.]
MIFSIAFLVLLVFLFVEIFRYIKVKANAFSRAEVKKAAEEQVRKITYRDPVISCDYCGGKIDTTKFKACPQCGAPFDNDEEWKSRHNVVSGNFIDKSTDALITARERKSQEESKKILKNIKKTIIALVAMILVIAILAATVTVADSPGKYRKTEKLEDGTYYKYVKADYQIDGDGVIFDYDDVKITVTGFYTKEYEYSSSEPDGPVAVEFHVENNRDEDIKISISCNSVNGFSTNSSYVYMYDTYKKSSDVVIYEDFRSVPGQIISEMIFDDIKIRNTDYSYEKIPFEPSVIRTTASYTGEFDFDDYVQLYSDDRVDIFAVYTDTLSHDAYKIAIHNKSDLNLYVSSEEMKIDNMVAEPSGLYRSYMPAGYVLNAPYVYPYGDEYKDLTGKSAALNINFECKEDPSKSFSTGYFDISKSLFK